MGDGVTPWAEILRWVVEESTLPHVTLETHALPRTDTSRRSLDWMQARLAELNVGTAAVPLRLMLESHNPLAPVRLAIAGLGNHGRTIQAAAEATPGVEVVGVFDPNAEEAALAAARFGIAASETYEAMLDLPGLDAVALVTPNRLHRAQAEAAFARGLHVFVEKPIAHTTEDGAAMIAAADRAGRVLMVGHNMRYSETALKAAEVIAAGGIGEVVSVEIHFSSDNGLRLAPGAWRLRPDEAPILPVTQLGIHALDLVHTLLGPIETVSAFARTVRTPAPVVDSVVSTFRLASGVMGTMTSHYCTPVRFAWVITGLAGHLHGTPHTLDRERPGEAPEPLVDVRATPAESYERQLRVFADAVRTGVAPASDGPSGQLALAVVEAMVASAEAGGRAHDGGLLLTPVRAPCMAPLPTYDPTIPPRPSRGPARAAASARGRGARADRAPAPLHDAQQLERLRRGRAALAERPVPLRRRHVVDVLRMEPRARLRRRRRPGDAAPPLPRHRQRGHGDAGRRHAPGASPPTGASRRRRTLPPSRAAPTPAPPTASGAPKTGA